MRAAVRVSLYLVLAVLLTGCVRALEVGSEPSPVYRLAVANDLAEEMIVSTSDGQGTRLLGAVPPGRTETFVVAGASSPAITVTARNAAGSRTAGPFQITLALGETVTVRLR